MRKPFFLWLIVICCFVVCGEEDATAPTVESTDPADGATDVVVSTNIIVTFNESMDAATVQANYVDTQPSGTVQVSSDGFQTVVRFSGGEASNENKTYTFTPMIDLDSATTYQIKITTGAQDVAGNPLESEFISNFTTG